MHKDVTGEKGKKIRKLQKVQDRVFVVGTIIMIRHGSLSAPRPRLRKRYTTDNCLRSALIVTAENQR